MKTDLGADLGLRMRARRTAAGRTVASVALDAGLSVPYVANLENGRGNPTLAALAALAEALGTRLAVDLIDGDARPTPVTIPDALARYAKTSRFAAEARLLAADGDEDAVRQRLLHAMAAVAALSPRTLTDLDWHRILDTVVLISRG